jgi:cytochrome d ubiquinol oxidase subunit I
MFGMAMIMALFVAPFQLLVGDQHGLNTLKHQPVKVAAMEGLWETQQGAPWTVFGWPDQDAEITRYAIEIPKLSSLILTHSLNGEVRGLTDWPKDERPPVAVVFWTFRIMFFLGSLMILTGLIALVLYFKKKLFDTRWFQYWCMAMGPSGFICVLAGWFVTEVGRQPYTVFGLLRTSDSASPVAASPIVISLGAFVFTYAFVFGAGVFYILRLIAKGPDTPLFTNASAYGDHGVKKPILAPGLDAKKGGPHV